MDFTAGLVANLLPGRTFAYSDHLLGNNIEFHLLMETPDDSGFAGRENLRVMSFLLTFLWLRKTSCIWVCRVLTHGYEI